jgi:hypothetical protein
LARVLSKAMMKVEGREKTRNMWRKRRIAKETEDERMTRKIKEKWYKISVTEITRERDKLKRTTRIKEQRIKEEDFYGLFCCTVSICNTRH